MEGSDVWVYLAGFFLFLWALNLEEERKQAKQEARKKVDFYLSDKLSDYKVYRGDFTRNTPKEREYRTKYFLTLLRVFGNRCANCGCTDSGVDLDHFIFPKSKGGNFIMNHKEGYKVNNAIPLCTTCNRSKGNRSYTTYFRDKGKLERILQKNQQMTALLNR